GGESEPTRTWAESWDWIDGDPEAQQQDTAATQWLWQNWLNSIRERKDGSSVRDDIRKAESRPAQEDDDDELPDTIDGIEDFWPEMQRKYLLKQEQAAAKQTEMQKKTAEFLRQRQQERIDKEKRDQKLVKRSIPFFAMIGFLYCV